MKQLACTKRSCWWIACRSEASAPTFATLSSRARWGSFPSPSFPSSASPSPSAGSTRFASSRSFCRPAVNRWDRSCNARIAGKPTLAISNFAGSAATSCQLAPEGESPAQTLERARPVSLAYRQGTGAERTKRREHPRAAKTKPRPKIAGRLESLRYRGRRESALASAKQHQRCDWPQATGAPLFRLRTLRQAYARGARRTVPYRDASLHRSALLLDLASPSPLRSYADASGNLQ